MELLDQIFDAVRAEYKPVKLKGIEVPAAVSAPADSSMSIGEALTITYGKPELRHQFIEAHPDYAIYLAQKDDHLYFGSYIQGDCEESIEWTVLQRETKKVFVVSTKIIDCKPFHRDNSRISWEESDIRAWLNSEFVDKAFSVEERRAIPFTPVIPDSNNNIYANHGRSTLDKVFLLSMEEAGMLLETENKRVSLPTSFALKNGVYEVTDGGPGWWWLRTPGYSPMIPTACYVNDKGVIKSLGGEISTPDNGVRPAMWIDIF